MGTITDKWLEPNGNIGTSQLYNGLSTSPVMDLTKGGQDGFMISPTEFVSSANYVQGNVVCILVEAPHGFNKMSYPEKRIATLKSLVEEQARTIEGLNSTLEVAVAETPIGGAGEMHQDITNVTRTRTAPSFMWSEKIGKAVSLFFEDWILQLGMDPETKVPQIVNYSNEVSPKDFLPSFRSMTCLFFEPDPSFRSVVNSWLVTNMFPLSAGDNTGKRDLTSEQAPLEITIEFTATTQRGIAVTNFAQKILDNMNLENKNPFHQPPFVDGISTDVNAASNGYLEDLKKA